MEDGTLPSATRVTAEGESGMINSGRCHFFRRVFGQKIIRTNSGEFKFDDKYEMQIFEWKFSQREGEGEGKGNDEIQAPWWI